jgi:hypothetical protein
MTLMTAYFVVVKTAAADSLILRPHWGLEQRKCQPQHKLIVEKNQRKWVWLLLMLHYGPANVSCFYFASENLISTAGHIYI